MISLGLSYFTHSSTCIMTSLISETLQITPSFYDKSSLPYSLHITLPALRLVQLTILHTKHYLHYVWSSLPYFTHNTTCITTGPAYHTLHNTTCITISLAYCTLHRTLPALQLVQPTVLDT